jgi:hypothetical protein
MTSKPNADNPKAHESKTHESKAKAPAHVSHPGMMGDGTEEQNLGEKGDPAARIKKADVEAAFAKPDTKK